MGNYPLRLYGEGLKEYYFTNLKCLIEYNGKQHYEPVDFLAEKKGLKVNRRKIK